MSVSGVVPGDFVALGEEIGSVFYSFTIVGDEVLFLLLLIGRCWCGFMLVPLLLCTWGACQWIPVDLTSAVRSVDCNLGID